MDLFQRRVTEFFSKKSEKERFDREVGEYSFFLIFGYIVIAIFSYILHTRLIYHDQIPVSIFLTTIIPMIVLTYYFFVQLGYAEKSEKEELSILNKELKDELEIAKIIPVVLFGLGIVYSSLYDKKLITMVYPYLACAILFGSLFPFMIRHMIIDESSIDRMIIADELIYISISQYFGLLLAILIIPLFYVQKWSKGKKI